MAMPEKLKPKVEWRVSCQNVSIYIDESLPKGTIELRDDKGNILGRIPGVTQLRIGAEL